MIKALNSSTEMFLKLSSVETLQHCGYFLWANNHSCPFLQADIFRCHWWELTWDTSAASSQISLLWFHSGAPWLPFRTPEFSIFSQSSALLICKSFLGVFRGLLAQNKFALILIFNIKRWKHPWRKRGERKGETWRFLLLSPAAWRRSKTS